MDQSRRLQIVSIAAALSAASIVHAGLPVFGGPSYGYAPGTGYVEADVPTAPGSVIANNGAAIGQATFRTASISDGGMRPMWWSPDDWHSLSIGGAPPSGVIDGHVYAINNAGTILYDYEEFSGNTSLGYRAGRRTDVGASQLPNLGASSSGVANTHALALNAAGVTVGNSSKWISNVFYGNRAVRWSGGNVANVEELGALQSKSGSSFVEASARDINTSGFTVGESGIYSGSTNLGMRAVKWNGAGAITQLGNLGVTADGYTNATAIAVNDVGIIAGTASKYDADHTWLGQRAVRYAANSTTAIELGGLGGTDVNGYSAARVQSMNESGLIVGASDRYLLGTNIGLRPVYWSTTGSTAATELPNLGVGNGITSGIANAANASNVIVGAVKKYVGNLNQGEHAVLWHTAGTDAIVDLNTLMEPNSGWVLVNAKGISDTGFISGLGIYDPDGQGPTASYYRMFSMLVPQAGTYGKGDATFDAKIDFADLVVLAQKYNQSNPTQSVNVADFDLNGVTDFQDLVILSQNYNSAGAGVSDDGFAADWALAQSFVPEPAALGAIFGIVTVMLRRRK